MMNRLQNRQNLSSPSRILRASAARLACLTRFASILQVRQTARVRYCRYKKFIEQACTGVGRDMMHLALWTMNTESIVAPMETKCTRLPGQGKGIGNLR